MGQSEIIALVLAAGISGRMERFKPLLGLGGQPLIARVVRTFREAGIRDVRVVAGHRKELLYPVVDKLKARLIVNERYAEGMFSSVQAGVSTIGPEVEAFFVLPVDMPLVSVPTIQLLAQCYRRDPGKILVPSFGGKDGHPPLIAAALKKCIINYHGGDGLKGALKQSRVDLVRVPVNDENILFDVDVPGDYRELQDRWERLHNLRAAGGEMTGAALTG